MQKLVALHRIIGLEAVRDQGIDFQRAGSDALKCLFKVFFINATGRFHGELVDLDLIKVEGGTSDV